MAQSLPPSPPLTSVSDSSDASLNHSPYISQDLPVSPHPTNGAHNAQIHSNNSHSSPLYRTSRLPLVKSISSSSMEAPLIFSETFPFSESAGILKQYSPQVPHATSAQTSPRQTFHSLGRAPASKSLCLRPHSSLNSMSRDVVQGESESKMGLGSAILLDNTTQLSQDAHQTRQQVAYKPDIQALLPIPRSIPAASIPIDRWPEFAQGILPFLDLTDKKILDALPYFRGAGYTQIHAMAQILEKYLEESVTRGLLIDKLTRQHLSTNLGSMNEKFIKPSSRVAPGLLHNRQKQEIGRPLYSHALIPRRGQNFATRPIRATNGGFGRSEESIRPLHPGIERPNEAVQRLRAETLRLEQAATARNSQYYHGPNPPTDASHRAISMHARLIATRDRALQRRSKSGAWSEKF